MGGRVSLYAKKKKEGNNQSVLIMAPLLPSSRAKTFLEATHFK